MAQLRWFRKHQKVLLVVFGVVLMFVFVLGSVMPFFGAGQLAGGGDREELKRQKQTVVQWAGGQFSRGQMQRLREMHFATIRFQEGLIEYARRNASWEFPAVQLIQPLAETASQEMADRDLFNRLLLAEYARQHMEMAVSDAMVRDYIAHIVDENPSDQQLAAINRGVNGPYVDYREVLEYMKLELMAMRLDDMLSDSVLFNGLLATPPANMLDGFLAYLQSEKRFECAVVEFKTQDYLPRVSGEPTDAEIKEIFERGKFDEPLPQRQRPGFKRPRQINVEYVLAHQQDFLDLAVQEVTHEQVLEEYNRLVAAEDPLVMENIPPPAEGEGLQDPANPAGDGTPPTPPGDPPPPPASDAPPTTPPAVPESGGGQGESEPTTPQPPADMPADAPTPPTPSGDSGGGGGSDDGAGRGTGDGAGDDRSGDAAARRREFERRVSGPRQEPADQDPPPQPAGPPQDPEMPAESPPQEPAQENPSDPAADAPIPPTAADPSAAQEMNQDEPPAPTTPPTQDPPAAETPPAPAAQETPPAPDKRPRPLDENLELMIKRRMKSAEANERLEKAIEKVRDDMSDHNLALADYEAARTLPAEEQLPKPDPIDLKALADKYHLRHGTTGLVTFDQCRETDFGKSQQFMINPQTQRPIAFSAAEAVFSQYDRTEPYTPEEFADGFVGKYVYWVLEKVETRIPALEESRGEVIDFWRQQQAYQLALADAEAAAAALRTSGEMLAVKNPQTARLTGEFSWFGSGGPVGVDKVSEEFMSTAFKLALNELGVAPNSDRTSVLLIQKVKSDARSDDELRDQFFKQVAAFKRPMNTQVLQAYSRQAIAEWLDRLNQEMNVQWLTY